MRRDDRGVHRRGGRQVLGIAEAAHVVAHHRARGERGSRDGGPPGVDRERDVEAAAQLLDRLDGQLALLRLTDRPDPDATGAGADVDHIGALPHEPLGVPQKRVQLEVLVAVVEGVPRAVQDAHDEDAAAQIEATRSKLELHDGIVESRTASTSARTCATCSRFAQRWSIGQRRCGHGLHSTCTRATRCRRDS